MIYAILFHVLCYESLVSVSCMYTTLCSPLPSFKYQYISCITIFGDVSFHDIDLKMHAHEYAQSPDLSNLAVGKPPLPLEA